MGCHHASSTVRAFGQEEDIALTIVRAKVCGDATEVLGDTGETVSRRIVEPASTNVRGPINVREWLPGADRVPGTAVICAGVRPRTFTSVLPEVVGKRTGRPSGITRNPRDINESPLGGYRGRTSNDSSCRSPGIRD